MRAWFDSLQPREQAFVIVGGTVLAAAVCYVLIWLPLDQGKRKMEADVETWERSLAELRPLKGLKTSAALGSQPSGANTLQTPVVIVDQSLRTRGLDGALKRSQPTTSNGIRVEFEDVVFDELVLWLGDLSTEFALQVSSGSFSTTSRSGPGQVNATLTLERAP
jgi:general secretion pathway protein M